ncbi:MAG: sialidase family protein, partial [Nitrososphaerales archaeon]
MLVSKWFWNNKDVAQEFTVIFDIRKEDVSVGIFLRAALADPRAQTTMFVSWTPDIPGEYQIRTFVVSNITKPEFLENVASARFNVMSDEEFMALYSDRPTSFTIVPADLARTSPDTLHVAFDEKQYLGNGSNAIRDISVSDDGLYVIGISELPPLREDSLADDANKFVFFTASNDRGLTFEPMQYLGNNTRGLTFVHHPVVHAINDTLVYAAWQQEAHHRDEFKLVLSKSLDGGRTFGQRITLDHGGVVSGDPDLAFSKDGRSLYIVLSHYYPEPLRSAIVFSKSNDYGQSFTPEQPILDYTGNEWINCLQIATQEVPDNSSDTNNVYLAWRQDSDDHRLRIMFSASHDGGMSFSKPIVVSDAYTDDHDCPWLAAYGDDVYLSWAEMKLIYKPEDPSEILVGDTDIFFV